MPLSCTHLHQGVNASSNLTFSSFTHNSQQNGKGIWICCGGNDISASILSSSLSSSISSSIMPASSFSHEKNKILPRRKNGAPIKQHQVRIAEIFSTGTPCGPESCIRTNIRLCARQAEGELLVEGMDVAAQPDKSIESEARRPSISDIAAQLKKSENVKIVAHFSAQGPRESMEDNLIIVSGMREEEADERKGGELNFGIDSSFFAGVFDGHVGTASSRFLSEELYHECSLALQGGSLLHSGDTDGIRDALVEAFLTADKKLLGRLSTLAEGEEDRASGSTAGVLIIGNGMIVNGCCGDTRAVLSKGGKAVDLSMDHRVYGRSKLAGKEIKRVKEAGGWVNNGRVCGYIAVSRAFGNIPLKMERDRFLAEGVKKGRWNDRFLRSIRIDEDSYWVTAQPDVSITPICPDSEFVILATDGLWDSLSSKDAVNFVQSKLREHGNVGRVCEEIVQHALKDKKGQDNVTVVIATLQQS